jgi:hypothetical protein
MLSFIKYSDGMQFADATTMLNWHALCLKRLAHLDELKRSGRWKRYFGTEKALEDALQIATDDAARWKHLAKKSQEDTA